MNGKGPDNVAGTLSATAREAKWSCFWSVMDFGVSEVAETGDDGALSGTEGSVSLSLIS
jgi:hypothetical protein